MKNKSVAMLVAMETAVILAVAGWNGSLANSGNTVYAEESYDESGRESENKLSMDELKNLYGQITDYGETLYQTKPVLKDGNYKVSALSTKAYQCAEELINYYRTCAGLGKISFDETLNESASYGALVDAAYGTLSHFPEQPADMSDDIYKKGYEATTTSNLSWSSGYDVNYVIPIAIGGQMDDSSAGNVTRVGHRRWLLNPGVQTMGIGVADNENGYFTDVRVFGENVQNTTVTDYNFIAWPASGNNLSDMFSTSTPWSVTLNPDRYQKPSEDSVKVTLTSVESGVKWSFDNSTDTSLIGSEYDYFGVDTGGYGVSNCIIFRPAFESLEEFSGDYIVNVTGIYDKSGNETSLNYRVTFDKAIKTDICNHNEIYWIKKPATMTTDGYTGDKLCLKCQEKMENGKVIARIKSVSLSKTSYIYNGKVQRPSVKIKDANGNVISSENYIVSYSKGCKNAGSYKVTIRLQGNYEGVITKTYIIAKVKQPMTVTPAGKNYKASSLKKKSASFSIKVRDEQGKVSYKSSSKNITVSSKGRVTVKKGIKKGNYTITVKANGNSNYKSGSKKIKVIIG